MKILEIDKKFLQREFSGDMEKCIDFLTENGLVFTAENIVNCFCGFSGDRNLIEAVKRLNRYITDNRKFCLFYDLENKMFI